MIKTETQIKRLEEIGTETMSLIRKAKNRMQVQLEETPSEYCDNFSRTHPLTLALDKFLTVFNFLDALICEVDVPDYRFYQENSGDTEQKMNGSKPMSTEQNVYLVTIEFLDEGVSEGLETQEAMIFKDKINAVTFCRNRLTQELFKAFENGEEYEFHNDDDEIFITIAERYQTHYIIENKTLMN